jgi:cell division protease FtsH
MDGLAGQENPIIVLGATNRAELLDPAVVRHGRFDRSVEITKPEIDDRIMLLNGALKKIQHAKNINFDSIARLTGGFSCAKLVNLMNDAAILAVSDGRTLIEATDIALAFDHMTLGRKIEGMQQSQEQLWKTAIHEAGHAIGWIFGKNSKYVVHKASIVPRSRTLGVVWVIPAVEFYDFTATEMKSKIVTALCGRVAELEFGMDLSNGATSDLAKANKLAYDMVVRYGMVPELYNTYYNKENPLLTGVINKEVKKIIDESTAMAKYLIAAHKQDIEKIAQLLMEKGTVLGDEIYNLLGLPIPQGAQFTLA